MAEAKELLTHPREARGEGIYVIVRLGYTMSGSMDDDPDGDDIDTPPAYRFDPTPTDG